MSWTSGMKLLVTQMVWKIFLKFREAIRNFFNSSITKPIFWKFENKKYNIFNSFRMKKELILNFMNEKKKLHANSRDKNSILT